jgi:hypothetical protein
VGSIPHPQHMAGSKAKCIYGNWIDIRNGCWSVGTKVGVMMMIAMLGVSGMYGSLLWLLRDSMVGCAFESFSSWILRRWDNPLSDGMCLSRKTWNSEVYLCFGPCHGLGLNSCLLGGDSLTWSHMLCSRFLAAEV